MTLSILSNRRSLLRFRPMLNWLDLSGWFNVPGRIAGCVLAILACGASAVQAGNPWASAIGEARVVQHRAEDIANRIKRTDPRNYLVREAMEFDRLSCAMVELLRGCNVCNRATCNQVQSLYHQMEGDWGQLRYALCADPCLRGDRTLKGLAESMDTRMRNLCKAIDRVMERELRNAPVPHYAPVPRYTLRPAYPDCPPNQSFPFGIHQAPAFGFQSQSQLELRFSTPSRMVVPHQLGYPSGIGSPSFGVPSTAIPFGVPSPYGNGAYPSMRVAPPQPGFGYQAGPRRSF